MNIKNRLKIVLTGTEATYEKNQTNSEFSASKVQFDNNSITQQSFLIFN